MTTLYIQPITITASNLSISIEPNPSRNGNPRFFALEVEEQLAYVAKVARGQLEARFGKQE